MLNEQQKKKQVERIEQVEIVAIEEWNNMEQKLLYIWEAIVVVEAAETEENCMDEETWGKRLDIKHCWLIIGKLWE